MSTGSSEGGKFELNTVERINFIRYCRDTGISVTVREDVLLEKAKELYEGREINEENLKALAEGVKLALEAQENLAELGQLSPQDLDSGLEEKLDEEPGLDAPPPLDETPPPLEAPPGPDKGKVITTSLEELENKGMLEPEGEIQPDAETSDLSGLMPKGPPKLPEGRIDGNKLLEALKEYAKERGLGKEPGSNELLALKNLAMLGGKAQENVGYVEEGGSSSYDREMVISFIKGHEEKIFGKLEQKQEESPFIEEEPDESPFVVPPSPNFGEEPEERLEEPQSETPTGGAAREAIDKLVSDLKTTEMPAVIDENIVSAENLHGAIGLINQELGLGLDPVKQADHAEEYVKSILGKQETYKRSEIRSTLEGLIEEGVPLVRYVSERFKKTTSSNEFSAKAQMAVEKNKQDFLSPVRGFYDAKRLEEFFEQLDKAIEHAESLDFIGKPGNYFSIDEVEEFATNSEYSGYIKKVLDNRKFRLNTKSKKKLAKAMRAIATTIGSNYIADVVLFDSAKKIFDKQKPPKGGDIMPPPSPESKKPEGRREYDPKAHSAPPAQAPVRKRSKIKSVLYTGLTIAAAVIAVYIIDTIRDSAQYISHKPAESVPEDYLNTLINLESRMGSQEKSLQDAAEDRKELSGKVSGLDESGKNRDTAIAAARTDIDNVKNEVVAVRGDVGAVKSDVGNIKSELGTVKESVGGLATKYDKDKTAREGLANKVEAMSGRLDALPDEVVKKVGEGFKAYLEEEKKKEEEKQVEDQQEKPVPVGPGPEPGPKPKDENDTYEKPPIDEQETEQPSVQPKDEQKTETPVEKGPEEKAGEDETKKPAESEKKVRKNKLEVEKAGLLWSLLNGRRDVAGYSANETANQLEFDFAAGGENLQLKLGLRGSYGKLSGDIEGSNDRVDYIVGLNLSKLLENTAVNVEADYLLCTTSGDYDIARDSLFVRKRGKRLEGYQFKVSADRLFKFFDLEVGAEAYARRAKGHVNSKAFLSDGTVFESNIDALIEEWGLTAKLKVKRLGKNEDGIYALVIYRDGLLKEDDLRYIQREWGIGVEVQKTIHKQLYLFGRAEVTQCMNKTVGAAGLDPHDRTQGRAVVGVALGGR